MPIAMNKTNDPIMKRKEIPSVAVTVPLKSRCTHWVCSESFTRLGRNIAKANELADSHEY